MTNTDTTIAKATANVSIDTEITSPVISTDTAVAEITPAPKQTIKKTKKSAEKKTDKKDSKTKKNGKDKSVKTEEPAEEKTSKKKIVVKGKKSKEKPEEKPQEESLYDKMFPKTFIVNGVKFTRVELQADEKGNYILAVKNELISEKYLSTENLALCLAFNWEREMLQRKGKNASRPSDYEVSTGFIPPAEFPANLDMSIVDAALISRADMILSHSIYTEYPGFIEIEKVFKKRTKEKWFNAYDAPLELYCADYSNADESVEGTFINLYTAKNTEK